MASLFTSGRYQGFDGAVPAAGGLLYTYAAGGTTTPLATYTTQALNVPNANPVVLDASGRKPVWLGASSYRMVLKSALGVPISDDDNISGNAIASLATNAGAGLVGFNATDTYASGTVGAALKRFDPTLAPWLADKTGATSASAAINACAAAAGSNSVLVFPPGTYNVSDGLLKLSASYQRWESQGAIFSFNPTAHDLVALTIKDAAAGSIWITGIKGFRFTSADSTYRKTAIEVFDARLCVIDGVVVNGTVVRGSTNFWSGGAYSTGLRVRGREFVRLLGNSYIAADLPIRLSKSENTSTVGVDHSTFNDSVLLGYQQPKVLIDSDCVVTNSGFDEISMNLGRQGVLWLSTSNGTNSSNVWFRNFRSEQGENPADYIMDIQFTGTARLQGLAIANGNADITAAGIRLAGVQRAMVESWYHPGTGVALNLSATVDGFEANNCFWQAASTATLTGQRMIWGTTLIPNTAPLPPNFILEPSTNTKRSMVLGGSVAQTPFALAVDAVSSLGSASERIGGLVVVVDDRGICALFMVLGSQGTLTEVSDPAGAYTTIENNASSINVYWHAGSGEYRVQNKTAATRTISITVAGRYGL